MADGTPGPKSRRGLAFLVDRVALMTKRYALYFRFDLCRLVLKIRPTNELIYFLCLQYIFCTTGYDVRKIPFANKGTTIQFSYMASLAASLDLLSRI